MKLTVPESDAWTDGYHFDTHSGGIGTDPNGFGWAKTTWPHVAGILYRRLMWSPWFATIVRVGGFGTEEHVLAFKPAGDARDGVYTGTFTPRKHGEVFVFVNDSVIGLPRICDYFYRTNNKGKASLTLRLAEPEHR